MKVFLVCFFAAGVVQFQSFGQQTGGVALVTHAPVLNGNALVEGSIQQMLGGNVTLDEWNVTLNGRAIITGDLLVPGVPQVNLNGHPVFGGTVVGTGSAIPTNYTVTLNGNAQLGRLLTRTDPTVLAAVPAIPAPTGTRDVSVNTAGQDIGSFSTLRNLTLNSNVGQVAVPAGTYGDFTANGGSGFTLGVAGTNPSTPTVYNFQRLTLSGASSLQIVGPVVINVVNTVTINGQAGAVQNPQWLQLNIANGGLTLNGGSHLYGYVNAPAASSGQVTINGNAELNGGLIANRLTVNGGGILRLTPAQSVNNPPTAGGVTAQTAEDTATTITLSGSDPENDALTYFIVTPPAHGSVTLTGNTVTYTPAANYNGPDLFTYKVTDALGLESAPATVTITVTPVNDPPVVTLTSPADDALFDYPLTLPLAAQASDPDGTVAKVEFFVDGVKIGEDTSADYNFSWQAATGGVHQIQAKATDNAGATATSDVVDVELNQSPVVEAGANTNVTIGNAMALSGQAQDDGLPSGSSLTVNWRKVSGPGSVTFSNAGAPVTTATFSATGDYVLLLSASDGRSIATDTLRVTVSAPNQPPVVNAGPSKQVEIGQAVALNGAVSDDGLPVGVLQVAWSKVSGPGSVAFGSPASALTTAQFGAVGTYVLKLSASDSAASAEDEVTVTVTVRSNTPPTVDAGPDQMLAGTNAAQLAGSVKDDGLPQGAIVTLQWEKVSGPGTVTFGSPGEESTSAFLGAPGTYVLRLTASDGEAQASATVMVSASFANAAPTVEAGADVSVTLPEEAQLHGRITDDGLPAGSVVSQQWEKISGPGTVTFSESGAASSGASFSAPGAYVLRLTAADSALSASDDVAVSVADSAFRTKIYTTTADFNDDGKGRFSRVDASVADQLQLLRGLTHPDASTHFTGYIEPTNFYRRRTFRDWDSLVFGVNSVVEDGRLVDGHVTYDVNGDGTATIVESTGNYAPLTSFQLGRVLPLSQVVACNEEIISDLQRNYLNHSNGLYCLNSDLSQDTPLSGTWTTIYDSGTAGQKWGGITWNAFLPDGGNLIITTSSGEDGVVFGDTLLAVPGQTLPVPDGRYLKITVELQRSGGDRSPVLYDLTVGTDGYVPQGVQNLPPTVSAGENSAIHWPSAVNLNGVVSDDGLPNGSRFARWTKVSGPGDVTFVNDQSARTAASFSAPGVYALRLSVSDTALTSSATVEINAETFFAPPQSDLGPDQVIPFGAQPVLSGSISNLGALFGVEALVVAGGGGGSNDHGGGGGGGGVLYASSLSVTPGVSYPVAVGNGGVAGGGRYGGPASTNGENSVFQSIVALGGGYSGAYAWMPGNSGGSGGGGSGADTPANNLKGLGTPGQGNDGGDGSARPSYRAGGGGGAGGVGSMGSSGSIGHGGIGALSSISGTSAYYGGGGGGSNEGRGGLGGGGNGGYPKPATPGAANTGGGGGGGAGSGAGGGGGSGIVIVRYEGAPKASGGSVTTSGGHTIHTFTSNGAFVAASTLSASTLSYQWSALGANAGAVSFQNASLRETTVEFSAPGSYTLRLTVTDADGRSGYDDVVVVVAASGETLPPGSFAVSGNAGSNQSVTAGNGVQLSGSGTTAGPGPLEYEWVQVAGPVVALNDARTATPGFTAPALVAGASLTFRLFVNDGPVYAQPSEVTVTVLGGGGAGNAAPMVSAGPDASVARGLWRSLDGTVTDDNLPIGAPVTAQWFVISGPGDVEMTEEDSLAPQVRFLRTGTYVFRLEASDTQLLASDDVTITVFSDSGVINAAPQVSAGADVTIPFGAILAMGGAAVSDDGLPVNGQLTTQWVAIGENAGQVNFQNAAAIGSRVTFAAPGDFLLRLVASDGALSASDDLVVRVLAPDEPPPPAPVLVTASAGAGGTVAGGTLVTLDGSGTTTGPGPLQYQWSQISGPAVALSSQPSIVAPTPSTSPSSSLNSQPSFTAPTLQNTADLTFRLFVNDGTVFSLPSDVTITVQGGGVQNAAPVVNAGPDAGGTVNVLLTLNGAVTDDGLPAGAPLASQWYIVSGPGDAFLADAAAPVTQATFTEPGTYVLRLIANDTQLAGQDDVAITVAAAGPNTAPIVNAGPDTSVARNSILPLLGSVSDDGQPRNTLTTLWEKVSGPGNVLFSNPSTLNSQPTTTATFSAPGAYVLRLTAFDTELSAVDEITVTVTEQVNQPPTVALGPDVITDVAGTVLLTPEITDDGLPSGILNTNYRQVGGPAGLTMARNGAGVNLTFTQGGIFIVRGEASDGVLTGSDDIRIYVDAPNTAPAVSAGSDRSARLAGGITLSGSATDDGLPLGSTLALAWSKVSGPGTVAFGNPQLLTTTATFSAPGSYVLRLTASDGLLATSDETTVFATDGALGPEVEILSPTSAFSVAAGSPLTVDVFAQDIEGGLASVQIAVDGAPLGQAVPTAPGNYSLTTGALPPGSHTITATATNNEGISATASVTVSAIDPNTGNAPLLVELLTPAEGGVVTQPTTVTGTVSGTLLSGWQLFYKSERLECTTWVQFAQGTGPVSEGALGTLDPTLLLNGIYRIRLQASDALGRVVYTEGSVVVDGGMKAGAFTLGFSDLEVPLSGMPITVTRTYDSRDQCAGDFGPGWRLDVNTIRLEKNLPLGEAWIYGRIPESPSLTTIPTYYIQDAGPHVVTISAGDGQVYRFAVVMKYRAPNGSLQPAQRIAAPWQYSDPFVMQFEPLPGTVASLKATGIPDLYMDGSDYREVRWLTESLDNVIGGDIDGAYFTDATGWELTLQDGRMLTFDGAGRILTSRDRNANELTFARDGNGRVTDISHSAGLGISFIRDGAGRITSITDPNGAPMRYTYDSEGRLITFKDRVAVSTANSQPSTTFAYKPGTNYLQDILDSRGIRAIRSEYDESGRLVRTIDADGRATTITHNVNGRTQTVTDRLGHTTTQAYDARGNVTSSTDALGRVTTATFDANDNKLTETNPLGQTTTMTYDAADRLLTMRDSLGNTTTFAYNAFSQPLTVTDPLGRVTTYTYDSRGNASGVTNADGSATAYTYDAAGNQVSQTDALGHTSASTYNALGRMITATDTLAHTTTFTYDANGNVLRTLLPDGSETINTLDALDRVVSSHAADGAVTQTVYNSIGQVEQTIDPLGRQTTREFDAQGRVAKTVYPDGLFESQTYDAEGRRITSTDRAGRVTTYQYDPVGRHVRTIAPDATITQTVYDAVGRVSASIDARTNRTEYTYDAVGRRATVKNALNQTTTFAYDAAGNQTSFTDALGRTTIHEYDSLNRRTRTIFPDGTTTQTAYDALGRRVSETDQNDISKSFAYDPVGQMTSVTDALGGVTRYTYDALGNQLTQTDALNRSTAYEYDSVGRRVKRTLPMGQFETVAYNAVGSMTTQTDFNGKTATYAYDVMNRLISRTPAASFSEPPITWTYTPTGRRATMTDASGTTTYAYDNRDRLITKNTPQGSLSYGYNATGSVTSIISNTSEGAGMAYTYDPLNRLASVDDGDALGTTTYAYDGVGNLAQFTTPNGVKHQYTYNNLNRLTNLAVTSAAPTTLAGYAYTLASSGHRIGVNELGGRSVDYAYDSNYRLIEETIAGDVASNKNGMFGYTFDAVGNRLTKTSTVTGHPGANSSYDANDRLGSDTYDNNGNTLSGTTGQGVGGTQIVNATFDSFNRLITATTSAGASVTFTYDGDGNKVREVVNGQATSFLYDDLNPTGYSQVVEEKSDGAVTRVYTWGSDLISQEIRTGAGQPWTKSYCGYDGHGSVRLLTDGVGAVTDTYTYDAFGNLLGKTGTTPNRYRFGGEKLIESLGIYDDRARGYNAYTGRFMTMDSYEGSPSDPASLHKYTYCNNDPVNNSDPSGNFTLIEINFSFNIANSLHGIYDAVVTTTGSALTDTIQGVQEGLTTDEIYQDYLTNIAYGIGVGIVVGKVIGVAKPLPVVDDLSRAAGTLDKRGFTRAGRSLTKHGVGARFGNSLFPAAKGNPAAINQQAQNIVDEILTTPGTTFQNSYRGRFGDTIEATAPDGRGIVYDANGKFLFFKEEQL